MWAMCPRIRTTCFLILTRLCQLYPLPSQLAEIHWRCLTVFCLLICFFHISATSPYLFGLVFCSQIVSAPFVLRVAVNTNGYIKETSTRNRILERTFISLFSFWNLDIFRAFYEPFCIHPHMTVVQALASHCNISSHADSIGTSSCVTS